MYTEYKIKIGQFGGSMFRSQGRTAKTMRGNGRMKFHSSNGLLPGSSVQPHLSVSILAIRQARARVWSLAWSSLVRSLLAERRDETVSATWAIQSRMVHINSMPEKLSERRIHRNTIARGEGRIFFEKYIKFNRVLKFFDEMSVHDCLSLLHSAEKKKAERAS